MKKLLLLSTLLFATGCLIADCDSDCKKVLTTLTPRSQERNRPEQLVGFCDQMYLLDAGPFYGTAAVTASYSKTFKGHHIAEAFFGPALFCNGDYQYLKIQGNSYLGTNRDPKALFADYFYLPQDYSGKIFFNPRIQNYSADLDLYFGLNNVSDGLYVRIHSPIVYTQWNLNMCEKIITPGSVDDTYGYFTPDILSANQLLSRFSQYGCGKAPGNGSITQKQNNLIKFDATSTITDFTILFDPLQYAKLSTGSQSKTRLGDIRLEVGNVFKETEQYSMSANLQLLIPTGTKKKAEYLFEPVIGNGGYWELGGGFQGQYILYKSSSKDSHASLHGDFNITHLFKTDQKRTFDLKGKELSRYMLATRFTYAVNGQDDQVVPSAQFANEYAPIANISTLNVTVSVGIQIDASAFIHYRKNKWDFDLGYNLWYRSKEHIKCQTTTPYCNELLPVCDPANKNRWALKGDARMYGFEAQSGPPYWVRPLSATESQSTIYQGTNKAVVDCNGTITHNVNIDNAQLLDQFFDYTAACPFSLVSPTSNINTSINPIFIQCSDLDIQGSRSVSNKVFANTAYSGKWRDYKTTFGLGGSADFGIHDSDNRTNFAVSQWAIWIKGALAFD